MPIKLFQSKKDISLSNEYMTFFNNQMYRREELPKVHWWVWTDTVKWQYVSDLKTIQILNEGFEQWENRNEFQRI